MWGVFFTLWSSELQPEVEWLEMGSGSSTSAPAGCVVGEEDVQAATPPKHRLFAPHKQSAVTYQALLTQRQAGAGPGKLPQLCPK